MPIAMSACEAWALRKDEKKKLEISYLQVFVFDQ